MDCAQMSTTAPVTLAEQMRCLKRFLRMIADKIEGTSDESQDFWIEERAAMRAILANLEAQQDEGK